MKSLFLIALSFMMMTTAVIANGDKKIPISENKPTLDVIFSGLEGDFLLFTVKTENVAPKTFFTIRNEEGMELYRELHTDTSSIRRIRIPRASLRQIYFALGARKQQCVRKFTINTRIEETINVLEVGQ
jgi:hypothetical protein